MIIVCTLCFSDVNIPLNEFLDLKDDDEYVCPDCENRVRRWVMEQNRPDILNANDFEEINSN